MDPDGEVAAILAPSAQQSLSELISKQKEEANLRSMRMLAHQTGSSPAHFTASAHSSLPNHFHVVNDTESDDTTQAGNYGLLYRLI